MIVSGISLLYQKIDKEGVSNVVRCYVDDYVEGQDEYFYKANAERHFKNDIKLIGTTFWRKMLMDNNLTDQNEEYYINCIGIDDRLHCCLPWDDKCRCGVKVKKKTVNFHDWINKFSCGDCDSLGG